MGELINKLESAWHTFTKTENDVGDVLLAFQFEMKCISNEKPEHFS